MWIATVRALCSLRRVTQTFPTATRPALHRRLCERAADRGRDTLGFVVSERPALATQLWCTAWCAILPSGVLLRFERHGAGELTRDETIRADLEQCARLAGPARGRGSDYVGIGPWNGAGLAAHIRGRMPEHEPGASDRRIVELCSVDLVRKIYKRLTQVGDGRSMPMVCSGRWSRFAGASLRCCWGWMSSNWPISGRACTR